MPLRHAQLLAGVAVVLHVLQGRAAAGQPGLPALGSVLSRSRPAAADSVVVHALALLSAGAVHCQLAPPVHSKPCLQFLQRVNACPCNVFPKMVDLWTQSPRHTGWRLLEWLDHICKTGRHLPPAYVLLQALGWRQGKKAADISYVTYSCLRAKVSIFLAAAVPITVPTARERQGKDIRGQIHPAGRAQDVMIVRLLAVAVQAIACQLVAWEVAGPLLLCALFADLELHTRHHMCAQMGD